MSYTDGFVIPIPKENINEYREMAQVAGKVWRDHGAIDYKECVADDLEVQFGTSFTKAFDLRAEETVVFSWIVYESREERDRINAAVMEDPRMAPYMEEGKPMPFDIERMVYGGFEVLVE